MSRDSIGANKYLLVPPGFILAGSCREKLQYHALRRKLPAAAVQKPQWGEGFELLVDCQEQLRA